MRRRVVRSARDLFGAALAGGPPRRRRRGPRPDAGRPPGHLSRPDPVLRAALGAARQAGSAPCRLAASIGPLPPFERYIGAPVLLRCIDTALAIAIGVLVAELVPAGSRAIALSLVGLAAGGGIALATVSLPLAASGRAGF